MGLTAISFFLPYVWESHDSPHSCAIAPVPKCCREEVEEAGKKAKMDEIYQKLKPMGLLEGSSLEIQG